VTQVNWRVIAAQAARVAWVLFFISLPVTSFPLFPADLGGRTLVRPLAIYPLVILLVLLIIPRLIKRPMPSTYLPLLAFTLVALISTVFAFTSDLEAFRGITPVSRLVRNLITLGLGLSFYFTTTMLHETWEDLRFSLRWLYIGMGLALLWGTVQIPLVFYNSPLYYKAVNFFQSLISTRKLFSTRVSGLTYEPKWFAEQICFLLFPWLIGSVLAGKSCFRWRWRRVTIEMLLLLWAVGVLVFTFSRTGLVILAALSLIGYVLYRYYFHKKPHHTGRPIRRRVLEASAIILVMLAGIFIVGSQNSYFSRLWRYFTEATQQRQRSYLEYIAVEQRFVYWETAFHMFNSYPWLGVGLGNYAFYFDQMLPNQPWNEQKEIVRQITPGEGRDRLITAKNLYARLMAETGILGTAAFTTFLIAIIGCALFLWFSPHPEQKFWGISAFLALIVFGFVIFAFDSFALPNMWIVFGLITSAAHLPDPSDQTNPAPVTSEV
jgi:O-antigen ligase